MTSYDKLREWINDEFIAASESFDDSNVTLTKLSMAAVNMAEARSYEGGSETYYCTFCESHKNCMSFCPASIVDREARRFQ